MKEIDLVVIGGGAAGFFGAINFAEKNPDSSVLILEKSNRLLSKVKISGGGRCNVTHACFIPKDLVKFYPRGHKELLGPFHKFMTGDMMEWLENKGVALKIEDDNRVFPASDDSQSIIDCFLNESKRLNIQIQTQQAVTGFYPEGTGWKIKTLNTNYKAKNILLATGGNSKIIQEQLNKLGIKTLPNIPALFTFNTKDLRFKDRAGVVVPYATIKIAGTKLKESGALLITHRGISGPAVLKLSSVGAIALYDKNYKFTALIDWVTPYDATEIKETFTTLQEEHPKKHIINTPLFELPKKMWSSLVAYTKIPKDKIWGEIGKKDLNKLTEVLKNSQIQINGKNTNKEEFVTCGGVDLKEMDFTRFSTKKYPNLFIAGELLNIDALTGGFNFQAAWTGSYIASQNIEV